MVQIDDWSLLTTVNYYGGMCGDFFSTLLDNNFCDSSEQNFSFDERLRYSYKKNAFLNYLKMFEYFYEPYEPSHTLENDNIPFIQRVNEVKNIVTADTNEKVSDNLRQYCYDNFKQNFYRRRVFSVHSAAKQCAPLQHTFPKSKNIFLHTNNVQFNKLSRVLFAHKTGYEFFKVNNNIMTVGNLWKYSGSVDDMIRRCLYERPNISYFNEYHVDVFELIFNNKNYDQQLSDYLETDIILNKSDIEFYRDNNLKILKSYNIDLYYQYNNEDLFKLMKEAIMSIIYSNEKQNN